MAGMNSQSNEVPFGGRLSSGLDAAVRAQVEHQLARGIDPDRIHELVDSIPYESLFDGVFEAVYGNLQEGRPSIIEHLDEGQRLVQEALVGVWGPADELFRACIYGSWELGGAISRASKQHGPRVFALLGLHGRAVRVSGEVRHLAMGGFESGATARQRSLHDIAVAALILSGSPEDIARRYLDFSYIEVLGDIRQYQKHAAALGRKPFSEAEVQAAEAAADRVVGKWGSAMRKQNGWAQPLLPEAKRISSSDLETLSGLQHLRPFYRLGNHFVHAGPHASALNMREDPSSDARLITAGPTVMADIAETCHGAMISLEQATAALATVYLSNRPEGPVDIVVALRALSMFVRDAGPAYGAAADRARKLGWFSHKPGD